MATDVAPAPRERGWKYVLIALAAFLLVPLIPPVRAFAPVAQTPVLLVPAIAACALVGWRAGGRFTLALIWCALTFWIMTRVPAAGGDSASYTSIARGWGLLAAATFGLVSLAAPGRRFLPRALVGIGIAVGVALLLSAVGIVTFAGAERAIEAQYEQRNAEAVTELRRWAARNESEWSSFVERFPGAERLLPDSEQMLSTLSRLAILVFPALLAIESLAALALAWSLYHRVTRVRIGAPLSTLREFRFSDQLVWALVAGIAIVLLPGLTVLRSAGLNLLVFFGTLYALRGVGVLFWLLAPYDFAIALACIVGVLAWPLFTAVALGLGLGDTWRDWRKPRRVT
ncbi:MAG: DUF2232 domain-containing protein [Gemmatimonadaceae bacterium]